MFYITAYHIVLSENHNDVLIMTSASGTVQYGLYRPHGHEYGCIVAQVIMYFFPEIPFRIIIVNSLSRVINLVNNWRVEITYPPHVELIHNEYDELSTYEMSQSIPNAVNFLFYKPPPDCLHQMQQHDSVQRNDNNRLNNDWLEEVTIVNRYKKHRPKF